MLAVSTAVRWVVHVVDSLVATMADQMEHKTVDKKAGLMVVQTVDKKAGSSVEKWVVQKAVC